MSDGWQREIWKACESRAEEEDAWHATRYPRRGREPEHHEPRKETRVRLPPRNFVSTWYSVGFLEEWGAATGGETHRAWSLDSMPTYANNCRLDLKEKGQSLEPATDREALSCNSLQKRTRANPAACIPLSPPETPCRRDITVCHACLSLFPGSDISAQHGIKRQTACIRV